MSDASIMLEPIVSWPREVRFGGRYVLTVDLRTTTEPDEWPNYSEEFEFSCLLDALPAFVSRALDEPVLVLHRFGGTYGPIRFLLTAQGSNEEGESIWVTFVNRWGVPVRTIELPVRFVPALEHDEHRSTDAYVRVEQRTQSNEDEMDSAVETESPDELESAVQREAVGEDGSFLSRVGRVASRFLSPGRRRRNAADRYTKAIGQLGDDRVVVRLDGIYALESLAVDSQEDHPTVVEVLSAFVREGSESNQVKTLTFDPGLPQISTDVQAALTVLGRLPVRRGVHRGDLSEANLSEANLSEANLIAADLGRANLIGANFYRANLTRVDLTAANLDGARLTDANLTEARLTEANLNDATLVGADLTGADLSSAKLTYVNFAGAKLIDAYLSQADLTGAANLTDDQIASGQGDATTTLPEGVTRPDSWA